MLRAVLSDVHANLEALEVVLADVADSGAEELLCLGDFVGYGASPNECIERLRPLLAAAVVGNHDLAASGRIRVGGFSNHAAVAARWTGTVLSPENRAWLESLPLVERRAGALLVHAAPAEPAAWQYVLSTGDARLEFDAFDEPLCLIGHSHYPGAFRLPLAGGEVAYSRAEEVRLEPGFRFLVNAPSVGQPRDGDSRAGYLLWDDAGGWLRHVRLAYDFGETRQRILQAGLPRFLGERLERGE
ncbi:MAG TPA: metallophosphoesterase [Terriglobales bacterium]|nr:metallophosphoesterase [Terriglobales bacterium]